MSNTYVPITDITDADVDDIGLDPVRPFINIGSPVTVAVAGDAITAVSTFMLVDTEAAASTDNLTTITGGIQGDLLILRSVSSDRDVTLIDGSSLNLASNFTLSNINDSIMLLCSSPNIWVELSRSTNS